MKPLNGYEKAQTYADRERLPAGGYVLRVLDVKYQENSWGDVIVLSFDILEGEQKNFFQQDYKNQTGEDKKWRGTYRLRVPADDGSSDDEWKMRRFKTVTTNFEESNPGYHWDWNEQGLKGKMIGALFNNKEYKFNGRHGFFTNCHNLVTVEKIRSGKFKIPDDTLLQKDDSNGLPASGFLDSNDFVNLPDGISDDELPFN